MPYFALSFELMTVIEKRYPNIKVDEAESVLVNYFDVLGVVDNKKIKFRIFANGAIEEIQANQK
jgi:hypothetical protein